LRTAVDAHSARLQELWRAISTDLQASTPALDSPRATLSEVTSLLGPRKASGNGQFKAPGAGRGVSTVTGHAGANLSPTRLIPVMPDRTENHGYSVSH